MTLLPFEYAARNAGRAPLRTILITCGAGAVVFLVILMGSFVESLSAMLGSTGEMNNVMVVGRGSEDFLEQSAIQANIPSVLAASVPTIEKQFGRPMVSPEIHHAAIVRDEPVVSGKQPLHEPAETHKGFVRGVTPVALSVHRQVFIRDGHFPQSGEIMAGKLAAAKIGLKPESLQTGGRIFFEGREWTISGTFDAPGTAFEAEIWAPLEELKNATKRDSYTCAIVRLESAGQFPEVDLFCKSRLDLELAAVPEMRYYGALSGFFKPMRTMGWIMAALVTVSGIFGGLNTFMASINARRREIACVETIGFSRLAIAVSLLQESLLHVSAGTLVACVASLTLLSGRSVRYTMGAVALEVRGPVLMAGIAAGLFLAIVGTLVPASRLFRRPLTELLRS